MTSLKQQFKAMKLQRDKLRPVIDKLKRKHHKEARKAIRFDLIKLKQELLK